MNTSRQTTSPKRSREIIVRNFFGIEEAVKHFAINPTTEQLATLKEIPYSEETLEKLRDSHMLVAVFPLSILDMHKKTSGNPEGWVFYETYRTDSKERFLNERCETGWHLIRKAPEPGTYSRDYKKQVSLLNKESGVPAACVMAYTIVGWYLVTKERLFSRCLARTSSRGRGGHIIVGSFSDPEGLVVGSESDWSCGDGRLRLASERLPNKA